VQSAPQPDSAVVVERGHRKASLSRDLVNNG
jgi:hypothetical protein